ncbi:TlpA disulfide reductase family protein [Flagellimonas onchidii]|uniref:TlpA disulfide reductase family protein n=1 Tax=Flagellimonas onchidii TaxID=2562684 RepID=UPI0010A63E99|nr:TlpA disulfide reductase family protein [Allomuricauda onchidii]
MKKSIPIVILLFIGIIASCKKENQGYRIEGQVTGFPDSTMVYLKNMETDSDFDSTMVMGNTFKFEGELPDIPLQVWFHSRIDQQFVYTNLFMGNDHMSLTGDIKDFPWNVNVSGSNLHNDFMALQGLTRELDIERDTMVRNFFKLPNDQRENKWKNLSSRMKSIDSTTKAIKIDFIRNNPDSHSSIINLGYLKNSIPKDSVEKFYNAYTPTIKASKYAKIVSIFLEDKILEKNDDYYDFTALSQENDSIQLSELRKGKYILLDFTAYNCGPCIMAAKELREIDQTHSDSLNIVSFSNDIKKEDWLKSLERDSVTWPSLWDGKGRYSKTAIKYGVNGFPTFFLIDPSGKIIDKWSGFGEGSLLAKLEKFKS